MSAAAAEKVQEIVPVTGLKDAQRWRVALEETVCNLVKDYERRVPGTQIEGLQIVRREQPTRVGGKITKISVKARVNLL